MARFVSTSILTLLVFFCATADLLGQTNSQIFLDAIQSVPETPSEGVWEIGGVKFRVDSNTKLVLDNKPDVGRMVTVNYVVRGKDVYALQIKPESYRALDVIDGPYVTWGTNKNATVVTVVDGKATVNRYENIGGKKVVDGLPGPESSIVLQPNIPDPPKSEWEMPSRLMAISDLEGNYKNTLRFLKKHGVVNEEGKWSWGDGHLVLVGDLVDRGSEVTELMWMLRRLEREAQESKGQVHYVLGNHEVMVMAGDTRYVHPKYGFICRALRVPYASLFGPSTEIGRWWRTRNAAIRVGDFLFVHGGYSPSLDEAELTLDELNDRVRNSLPPKRSNGLSVAANPVEHQHGPFWYRGYFKDYAAGWGGLATKEQVAKILKRHKAKHVVVGHTVVDQVGPISGLEQVIGIDVKWAKEEQGQGLLVENNEMFRLKMNGEKERISAGIKK